jgi:hypothetical protein
VNFSRRDFLNTTGLAAAAAITPNTSGLPLSDFPEAEKLGRIVVGIRRGRGIIDIKSRPDYGSANVGTYMEDDVIVCLREVVGTWPFRNVQRWIETPEGYVWAPNVQPVKNIKNPPVNEIPDGSSGFWVEVTVPWVNAELEANNSSWWYLVDTKFLPPRFYYGQILWVDQVKTNTDGKVLYRVNVRFGSLGDILWVSAEALKPLSADDFSPIHPEAENKQIVVDVTFERQTLACFEDGREVYFCRISSGATPAETPVSSFDSPGFNIYNKFNSLQMSGGTNDAGWMIPGIGFA